MSLASVLLAFAPAIAARLKPREKGERELELEAELKRLNEDVRRLNVELEHTRGASDAWRDRYLELWREREGRQAMQQMAQVAQYSQLQQNWAAMQNQQAFAQQQLGQQAQALHYQGLQNQLAQWQGAQPDRCSCTPSRANGLYGALRDDGP
jgi:hypothetical protein